MLTANDEAVWCVHCQHYTPIKNLKQWLADDDTIRWLCDGCDAELLPPESIENYIKRYINEA